MQTTKLVPPHWPGITNQTSYEPEGGRKFLVTLTQKNDVIGGTQPAPTPTAQQSPACCLSPSVLSLWRLPTTVVLPALHLLELPVPAYAHHLRTAHQATLLIWLLAAVTQFFSHLLFSRSLKCMSGSLPWSVGNFGGTASWGYWTWRG